MATGWILANRGIGDLGRLVLLLFGTHLLSLDQTTNAQRNCPDPRVAELAQCQFVCLQRCELRGSPLVYDPGWFLYQFGSHALFRRPGDLDASRFGALYPVQTLGMDRHGLFGLVGSQSTAIFAYLPSCHHLLVVFVCHEFAL